MWYRRVAYVIVCLVVSGSVTADEVAQGPSIVGHVLDSAGLPVPGATVTTIPQAGGIAKRATSARDGAYGFEALPEGTYRVDFELAGFDLFRRNHVEVRRGTTAHAHGTLFVSAICECVTVKPPVAVRERNGQVVDQSGRPLPHARLEIPLPHTQAVSPARDEVAYADAEGRFRVRVPVSSAWPMTASDTGFSKVTKQASWTSGLLTFVLLPRTDEKGIPETERFSRACRCPGDLFTHAGR